MTTRRTLSADGTKWEPTEEGVPSVVVSPKAELLKALAARCAAETPSLELEAAIARAIGKHVVGYKILLSWTECTGEQYARLPSYATDINAAVTLVPDWLEWQVRGGGRECEGRFFAVVCIESAIWEHDGDGATAALALCAAALSMLADIEQWGFEAAGFPAEPLPPLLNKEGS
jgi:hypothetical protein